MKPAITVIIPTYNWSAALRCAIRSVLLQTMQDFEVLVVGDGCTDDSAAVVAAFRDPRIRWHNLEQNHGSQWAANNHGIDNAAADWIAYLGHDDVWYPTHLEAVLRAARQRSADIVTSVMILYGPPDTGVRSVLGVFATGAMSIRDFVPPSAFAHARTLVGERRWPDAQTSVLPVDMAFMRDLFVSAKAPRSTNELTCFKFNAAWRRDAYKIKSTAEQEAMLEKIASGRDFRQTELLGVVQAVVADTFLRLGVPEAEGVAPGWFRERNNSIKGVASRFSPDQMQRIEGRTRFDVVGQGMPFEWHGLETHPIHGSFRWTGPSPRATIDLPVVFDRDLAIGLHIIMALSEQAIGTLKLAVHGQPLECRVDRQTDGTFLIHATARCSSLPGRDGEFSVALEVNPMLRPADIGAGEDFRWLGVAVNWIELEPVSS